MKPIARFGTFLLTTAALIGLPTDRAAAQGDLDTEPPIIAFATWDIMPEEASALLEEAELLLGQREYKKARKTFEQAAAIIRAEGGFPAEPMRRIAKSYYHQGLLQTAVSHLDDLAKKAAEVGDISSQAWALADAAWVLALECSTHTRGDHPGGKFELVDRSYHLRMLLASPYLPSDVRADIIRTRCGGCHSTEKPPQWAPK